MTRLSPKAPTWEAELPRSPLWEAVGRSSIGELWINSIASLRTGAGQRLAEIGRRRFTASAILLNAAGLLCALGPQSAGAFALCLLGILLMYYAGR